MKIYKKKIQILPVQKIKAPFVQKGDSIIDIGLQKGEPHIWFLADDSVEQEVILYSYMTGEEIAGRMDTKKYIGNYTLLNGIKMHVFVSCGEVTS